MHLRALYLHNFRVYEDALFEFSPQMNVIRGPNAHGKTSLLEAIYFLMTGRSFRTSQASDLIREGSKFFCVEAIFVKHGIEQKLRVYYDGKERRITHNATTYNSSSSLLGLLQGVVMHPDDAAIIKGGPATRRHLLDIQIAQADPAYVHYLVRYDKAMRQRNYLLKAKSTQGIESWEYEMGNSAAYVVRQRMRVSEELQVKAQGYYHNICQGNEAFTLKYKANGCGENYHLEIPALRDLYRDQFQRHRKKEMEFGATLTGPHKDDLLISLTNKEARAFASEGQQRSCVSALRLAEWARLKEASYEDPLMLVDDLGISLDLQRKEKMIEHFQGLGQVFVTTTETFEQLCEAKLIQIEAKVSATN